MAGRNCGCSLGFTLPTSVHCSVPVVGAVHCPLSDVTLFGGPLDQALDMELAGCDVTSVSDDDPSLDVPKDFCSPTKVRHPAKHTRRGEQLSFLAEQLSNEFEYSVTGAQNRKYIGKCTNATFALQHL